MLRRLFSFRKKKKEEARPSWWQGCDERACPVQLLCRGSGTPDGLARDQSIAAGWGHQCTATSVDDYEGVSWLEQLESPEWPVPKYCFENRDEDLSVSSCVESIWSRRRRTPSPSSGTARSVADKDWWALREDDSVQDAVMAKLGLQVTCLGSGSPMSKSYPGHKAVFSAHRGLSLYKSSGDSAVATDAAAAAPRSPTKHYCGTSTPESKPGAGDHRNLPNAQTFDYKYRNRSVKMEKEQGEQSVSAEQNGAPYAAGVECASFTVFQAETSMTSDISTCKYLEGLLEESQTSFRKENVTLDEDCCNMGDPCGSGNASGALHTSASSGDIKLDHIVDIDRRLHSTASRHNGSSGVEDRRLQLGLGDFNHWGGAVPRNRERRDTSSHSEVTGSGDCKEGNGGSYLPSASSPIPTEATGDGAHLGCTFDDFVGDDVKVMKSNPSRGHVIDNDTLKDESFSADVTLTDLSIGDCLEEADYEVASQLSSEPGEEFVDADYFTEPGERFLGAPLVNPTSLAYPHLDFQNELMAIPHGPRDSGWDGFKALNAQQGDGYSGTSEKRPATIGMVRKSASVSGERFDFVGTQFPRKEVTTFSAGSSPASMPPQFAFTVRGMERRQSGLSPTCSLDGEVSASSCDSFFTVASCDDDLSLPKVDPVGVVRSGESLLNRCLKAAVSSSFVSSPFRPESKSFQSYEDAGDCSCDIERGTGDAIVSGGPDELAHEAADEFALQRDGCSSSTTTLSFHLLDEQAAEESVTSASGQSEDSEEETSESDSPASVQSESPPSSPLSPSSFKSPTLSSTSNHATRSGRIESSPFSIPDYRSCRDFLRNLTDANPELSQSLSESFASDERGIDLDTSVEDACRQIFSSYNESFAQFESVQSFSALPRFSTTEMLTCPELRPLRLSRCREDVFEPVLNRNTGRRLKRQAVPTASDTDAFGSKVSEKRTHVSSASSVSMPDLKR